MKYEKVWVNAKIATFSEFISNPYGLIHSGIIAVKNGEIALVEAADKFKNIPIRADEIIDVKGKLITPGFIDCHTHLIYAGERSKEFEMRLEGKSYKKIIAEGGGIYSTVNEVKKLSIDELYKQSSLRLKALMEEGVTTIEIKSGYGLDIENERKMLLVATMLEKNFPITIKKTFLAHIIPHEYQKERETYLDKICNDIIPAFVKEELIDAVDVFCENIAFSMEETESIFKCAKKYNLPVKIHAEQLSNSGAAKLAVQYKALSADHLECLDEEGVKCIKESGTVATLLPGAYYFLREEKRPPIELFRKYQVNMAVSTDLNPGTSPFASILLILNMACLLYSLTPAESLKGVTINAAKALGIENTSGSIDKGKDADFVIWDILSPVMLVYQYGINPLIQVIKKGEVSICMKNL